MSRRALLGPQATRWFARSWLVAVFAFLYLPILTLILYSFNDSKLPSVWGGFTTRWYTELLQDGELLNGLKLSLQIAFATACASVLLGTFAAFALVKYKRFTGRPCSPAWSMRPW